MKIIKYDKSLVIYNIESMPGGLGCKYLVCFEDHNQRLIAKQWKRKQPSKLNDGEVLITFGE